MGVQNKRSEISVCMEAVAYRLMEMMLKALTEDFVLRSKKNKMCNEYLKRQVWEEEVIINIKTY